MAKSKTRTTVRREGRFATRKNQSKRDREVADRDHQIRGLQTRIHELEKQATVQTNNQRALDRLYTLVDGVLRPLGDARFIAFALANEEVVAKSLVPATPDERQQAIDQLARCRPKIGSMMDQEAIDALEAVYALASRYAACPMTACQREKNHEGPCEMKWKDP